MRELKRGTEWALGKGDAKLLQRSQKKDILTGVCNMDDRISYFQSMYFETLILLNAKEIQSNSPGVMGSLTG